MATRRPRIKAVANIGVKRKIKEEIIEPTEAKIQKEEAPQVKIIKSENIDEDPKQNIPAIEQKDQTESTKSEIILPPPPPPSSFQRQQLHEPTKSSESGRPRQRIKATPYIDVHRRNSLSSNSISLQSDAEVTPTIDLHESPFKDPPLKNTVKTPANRLTLENNRSTFGFLSPTFVSSPQKHPPPPQSPHPKDATTSREHIPSRQRKISYMEDPNKLTQARKEFQTKYSDKSPEKSVLKMFDFIYYNPTSNPMKVSSYKPESTPARSRDVSRASTPVAEEPLPASDIEEPTPLPVPQLKLGPNGEIILDEKSLVIETTAAQQARQNLASSKDCIYLDEHSGNNGFYSRQKRTKDWSSEETVKFYRCLHTVGTDFSLMLTLFPNRNRRDLKLKFKKEEKYNGHLVNKAILQPKAFDIEELKREFKKEEEAQVEKERQWKELEEQKAKIKRESLKASKAPYKSRSERAMKNGELAYQNECFLPMKRAPKRIKCPKAEEVIKINKALKGKESKVNKVLKADKVLEINQVPETETTVKPDPDFEEIHEKSENDIDAKCETLLEMIAEVDVENSDRLASRDRDLASSDRDSSDENQNNLSLNEQNCNKNNNNNPIEIIDIGEYFSIVDIMPQLASTGSLALVTSVDSENPDVQIHEIYILCKKFGTLSKKPLDLPKDTIDCILTAIGKYDEDET